MDLGKAALRRYGVNSLLNAVHPKHGLAWTDGICVYLAPVTVSDDEVDNDGSIKLGEFDDCTCSRCEQRFETPVLLRSHYREAHGAAPVRATARRVESLHWSCDQGTFVYLCAVHRNTVSLWKVDGAVPDLNLKQVRKINASPIPQGCLWSPCRDVLCILSKEQCSFYFRHSQTKGSYALPPIESGRIGCGCWAADGNKLAIGIGSIVLIYQWADIDKSISDFTITAWKIPSVDGRISAMASCSDHRMVCSAELPLDALCKQHVQHDQFVLPDVDSGLQVENGSVNTDDQDILRPLNYQAASHKDHLFNLPRRRQPVEMDSSQLIMFDIRNPMVEPAKVASIQVQGVLVPDLLCYQASSKTVTVGSNTQHTLQVFSALDDALAKVHQITLSDDERPKGVCCPPFVGYGQVEGVLLLIGRQENVDNTFVPPSPLADYDLRLEYHATVPDYDQLGSQCSNIPGNLFKEIQLPNGNAKVHLLRINPIRNTDKCEGHLVEDIDNTKHVSFKPTSRPESPLGDMLLPGTTMSHKSSSYSPNRIQLVDVENEINRELEVEGSTFSDHIPNFKNKLKKFFEQKTGSMLHHNSQSHDQHHVNGDVSFQGQRSGRLKHQSKQPFAAEMQCSISEGDGDTSLQLNLIETQIRNQGQHMNKLQQKLEELTRSLEDSVASTSSRSLYKPASNPDLVFLVYKTQAGLENRKAFLLDSGRLQLEMVKQAFGLQTLELLIGDVPCVLGCNPEGYIPLRFTPNSTMYVTGRRGNSSSSSISNC